MNEGESLRGESEVCNFRSGSTTSRFIHQFQPRIISCMDHQAAFELQNCMDDLTVMFDAAGEFAERAGLAEDSRFALEVCLEEMVTNVIKYAHDDGGIHSVSIRLSRSGENLTIVIEDDGSAFDPTQSPEVDLTLSLEDRPIGGLGLHMVKKMMDSLVYERVDAKNRLTMQRDLAKTRVSADAE